MNRQIDVNDTVMVKGNNELKDFEASFRGYANGEQAVIFDKKTGNQFSVSVKSLTLIKKYKRG